MRLLILLMISIMTLPLFADEVKPAEKSPEVTKPAEKGETTEKEKQPETKQINVVESLGTNVVLVDRLKDDYLVVDITSKVHNWWMMKLTGVKGKTVTVGFNMDEKGDVSKWSGLQPVYSYADPDKIESFEWFVKENGKWKSGNAFLPEEKRHAGEGKCPKQSVIPDEISNEFLSKDGNYWEPWGRIKNTDAAKKLNIYRFTHTFTQDVVWIAMRYPFSYELLSDIMNKIKFESKHDGNYEIICQSKENRKIYAITIESSRVFDSNPLSVVFISREHGTEPDGSWVIYGIINGIKAKSINEYPRVILLPIVDPDSVVNNKYEGIINSFNPIQSTVESLAIASFFREKRKTMYIDYLNTLHNVECNESANLWIPHVDIMNKVPIKLINDKVFNKLTSEKYLVTDKIREYTIQSNRLEGWITTKLGTLSNVIEINSQYPNYRLNLMQLQNIGVNILLAEDQCRSDSIISRRNNQDRLFQQYQALYRKMSIFRQSPLW